MHQHAVGCGLEAGKLPAGKQGADYAGQNVTASSGRHTAIAAGIHIQLIPTGYQRAGILQDEHTAETIAETAGTCGHIDRDPADRLRDQARHLSHMGSQHMILSEKLLQVLIRSDDIQCICMGKSPY